MSRLSKRVFLARARVSDTPVTLTARRNWHAFLPVSSVPLRETPRSISPSSTRHDYDGVSEDLAAWGPKICPGGLLAGHDFDEGAVARAVRHFKFAARRARRHAGRHERPPGLVALLPTAAPLLEGQMGACGPCLGGGGAASSFACMQSPCMIS